jgi:hypothetical protein
VFNPAGQADSTSWRYFEEAYRKVDWFGVLIISEEQDAAFMLRTLREGMQV